MAAGRPRNAVFIVFRSFGGNFTCKPVIKFLRRLKEAHLWVLDLHCKKIENIEKAGTRLNNCKFAKDSSIRVNLFKGKVQ